MTTEPLARGYTWGENIATPNVFHFQEQFAGKEGFENHKLTDHFKLWVIFTIFILFFDIFAKFYL